MGTNQMSPSSYYSVLGVDSGSSEDEIRRAYRRLAMQWHPDRWPRNSSLLNEAKCRFQQIQEAYSVLSDKGKRTMYDAGLYDPDDELDEGLSDFMQEMISLMAETKERDRGYSLEELQGMFSEMLEQFDCPQSSSRSQRSKKACFEMNRGLDGSSHHLQGTGLRMYGATGYCN